MVVIVLIVYLLYLSLKGDFLVKNQLKDYIKNVRKKGYTNKIIIKKLLLANYKNKTINFAFIELFFEKFTIKNVVLLFFSFFFLFLFFSSFSKFENILTDDTFLIETDDISKMNLYIVNKDKFQKQYNVKLEFEDSEIDISNKLFSNFINCKDSCSLMQLNSILGIQSDNPKYGEIKEDIELYVLRYKNEIIKSPISFELKGIFKFILHLQNNSKLNTTDIEQFNDVVLNYPINNLSINMIKAKYVQLILKQRYYDMAKMEINLPEICSLTTTNELIDPCFVLDYINLIDFCQSTITKEDYDKIINLSEQKYNETLQDICNFMLLDIVLDLPYYGLISD